MRSANVKVKRILDHSSLEIEMGNYSALSNQLADCILVQDTNLRIVILQPGPSTFDADDNLVKSTKYVYLGSIVLAEISITDSTSSFDILDAMVVQNSKIFFIIKITKKYEDPSTNYNA